jgi:transcriptional regulator with XRE-family HTH domain
MTLSELRNSKKLTQRGLARKMGVTNAALVKVERGEVTTTRLLRNYAYFLGVPVITVYEAYERSAPANVMNLN